MMENGLLGGSRGKRGHNSSPPVSFKREKYLKQHSDIFFHDDLKFAKKRNTFNVWKFRWKEKNFALFIANEEMFSQNLDVISLFTRFS